MYILAVTVGDKTSRLNFGTEREAKQSQVITDLMLEELDLEFESWIYEEEQEEGESLFEYEHGKIFY